MQSEGFRVTLWVHPFINNNCPAFTFADKQGYLVKVGLSSRFPVASQTLFLMLKYDFLY